MSLKDLKIILEKKNPDKDLVRPNEKKEKNSYQPPKITDESIRKAAEEADRHDKAQSKAIEDAHAKAMEILANKKKSESSKPVSKPVEPPKVEPAEKTTKEKVTNFVEKPSKSIKPKKVVTKPVEEAPNPSKKTEIINKAVAKKKKSVNPSEIKSKAADDITNNFKAERAKERQKALDNMNNEKGREAPKKSGKQIRTELIDKLESKGKSADFLKSPKEIKSSSIKKLSTKPEGETDEQRKERVEKLKAELKKSVAKKGGTTGFLDGKESFPVEKKPKEEPKKVSNPLKISRDSAANKLKNLTGKNKPVTKDNVSKVTMDAHYKPSKPSDSISHVSMPAHYVPKSARKSNASELTMPAYYTPKSEKKSHSKFKDFIKKGVDKAKEVGSEIKKRTIRDIPKLQNAYNKAKEKIGDAAFNAKFEYDWQKEKLKKHFDKKKAEKQSKVSDNTSKKVEEPKKSSDNNLEGSNASGYKPYHVAINHESKKYYRGKVVGTENNLERHTFMARDKNHALDQAHEHAINNNLQKYKVHSVHDDSGVRLSNNYEFNKKKDSNTPSQESPNKEYVVRVKRNKGIFNKKEVVTPTRVSAKNAEEANSKAIDAVKKEKGGRKHSVEGTYEKGKERTYSVTLQHEHHGLLGKRMKSSTMQVNHTNEQGAVEDAEKKYRKQYNVKPEQKVRITNTYRNAS